MNKLNFIGIGSATNVELGGNCCYYKDNDKLLLIDVCESATEKLKKLDIFDGITDIYIIITHMHFDHVGGLGIFIWYCTFVLKIKPKLIYSQESYSNNLKKLLELTGVNIKYVTFLKDSNLTINNLKITLQPTIHSSKLQCFGIMFSDEFGNYYYTGDTNDIDYIKVLCSNSKVKKIYTEVATTSNNVHIKYGDILNLDKKKLVLMHFDTVELYKKAIADGFCVAKIISDKEIHK